MNKNEIIKSLTSMITASVKSGNYCPEYPGEEPTLERIKASIPQIVLGLGSDDYNEVMSDVYKKLRKNGILARIREACC